MSNTIPPNTPDRSGRLALLGLLAGAVVFLVVIVTVCVWVVRTYLNSAGSLVHVEDVPPDPRAARLAVFTIGGVVLDDQNQPVADARVHLNSNGRLPGARDPHTDPQGRWKLAAVPNQLFNNPHFTVSATDFVNTELQLAAPDIAKLKDTAAVFVLHRGVDVSGRVVSESGAPIAGVNITSRDTWQQQNDNSPRATTDHDGNFTLHNLPPGNATLTATSPGVAPQMAQIKVQSGQTPPRIDMVMVTGRTLSGRVVDMDNQPVSGATVLLSAWHGVRSVDMRAATNDQGDFQIEHAPPDALTLAAQKDQFNREIVQFGPQRLLGNFTLSRLVTLNGSVVDSQTHKPLAAFQLIVGARRAALEPLLYAPGQLHQFNNGRYQLQLNGFAGQVDAWAVRIAAPGYLTAESGPLQQNGSRDFQLVRGQDFQGRVLGPDGNPQNQASVIELLPGQTLTLTNGNLAWNRSQSTSGGDGLFRIPPPPDNAVLVSLGADGMGRANHAALQLSRDLHEVPYGSLDLTMLTARGQPRRGQAHLLLYQSIGDDSQPSQLCQTVTGQTDAQGKVHLDRVLPGELNVTDLNPGRGAVAAIPHRVSVIPGQTASLTIRQ